MAIRNNFAPGEILAAGDLNDTFGSKLDYALPTNSQSGTTYTFVLADANKLTTATNASAKTFTIPPQSSVTWLDNSVIRVVNYGAGALTINGGSGVTVTNTASTLAQYQSAAAVRTGSDAWTLVPFGGRGAPSSVEYLVIAGGGGGGNTVASPTVEAASGGGAGGYRNSVSGETSGANSSAESPLSITANTSYTVTVGAGGAGISSYITPNAGTNSVLGSITSTGGGRGAGDGGGGSGGSGGGGGAGSVSRTGGAGTANQGRDGGTGFGSATTSQRAGGGGGGASGLGANAATNTPGNGGAGLASSITGTSTTRAGGGAGHNVGGTTGTGGSGGGGNTGASGTINTGSGGGGAGSGTSGSGGKGLVVVRHSSSFAVAQVTGSPIVNVSGGNVIYIFNDSGTIEWKV